MNSENRDAAPFAGLSRKRMFGISSALATAALAGVAANAQQTMNTRKAERDKSATDPGPDNIALLNENPNSNTPLLLTVETWGQFGTRLA